LLDGSRRVVYVPPKPTECEPLVDELIETVNAWIGQCRAGVASALPPICIAALACGRLIAIHPFAHGNGRTARAVATITLMTFGFRPLRAEHNDARATPVRTIEWYFDRHLSDYYAGLNAARRGNLPVWIDIFTEAVQATMEWPQVTLEETPQGNSAFIG
jgi:Fic family protein